MRIGFVVFVLGVSFILAPLAEAEVKIYTAATATQLKADLSMEISAVVTDAFGQRKGGVAVNWQVTPNIAGIAFNPTITDSNGRTHNTLLPQGITGPITITADAFAYGSGSKPLTLTTITPPCTYVADPFDVNWKSNHPCSMTFFDNSSFGAEREQAVNVWNEAKCSDNLPHVRFMGAFMSPDITIVNTCIQDPSISGSTTKNDDGTFTIALSLYIGWIPH